MDRISSEQMERRSYLGHLCDECGHYSDELFTVVDRDEDGESRADLCEECAERFEARDADADDAAAEAMDGDHETALASVYGGES